MLDINGRTLAVGQTIVVASKDLGPNVPVLKKGVIVELNEGHEETYNGHSYIAGAYIKIRYEASGRLSTIDGYMYMTDKRFCII